MRRLLAISWLTWKAALRFRLFWVLAGLLVGAVVVLPLVLKDDGTARGFTQILLTYTLGSIVAILGLATLWLSCGTLARDIEENQMQLVVVKPIARWQIWLGKWLGIMSLNAVLLIFAGTCVVVLLHWRSRSLPPDQQKILRNEVLVARGSLKEEPPDLEPIVERAFQQRIKEVPIPQASYPVVRNELMEAVKSQFQVVRPNVARYWEMDLGLRRFTLKDQPLYARVKFHAASTNALGTYRVRLVVGATNAPQLQQISDRTLAASTFHEIEIPPNSWDSKGIVRLEIRNYDTVALLFPLEDGFELLFRESGFVENFARGLLIILCWLALLASLGLAAASFLSFPVAAFLSASLLLVGFSTGTLAGAVEAGSIGGVNEETGEVGYSPFDFILIPVFRALLAIFGMVQKHSPIDALSTGRSIPWIEVAGTFVQVVIVLGGLIALAGIAVFTRRELAQSSTNA